MADKELQQAGSQALLKLPAYLKRGIDPSKLEVVQGPPEKAYGNHDAIASIDPGNHNRIIVHDRTAFLADPNSTAQVVGHELSHAVMDTNPSIYKPITGDNPYDVDLNNLQGKKLSDLNQEQIANVVQNDIAARTQPGLTPQRRQELIKQFSPITDQIGSLKPGTINNDQTGQVDNPTDSPTNLLKPGTMNTTPNAPQPMFDAMPTVTLPASGPLPQSGSQSQSNSFGDDDIIHPQEPSQGSFTDDDIQTSEPSTTQQMNQRAIEGGKGFAKGLGEMLEGTSPAGTLISQIPAVQRALTASNDDQKHGKIGAALMSLLIPSPGSEATLTDEGVSAVSNAAKKYLGDKTITDAMHSDVQGVMQKVAAEHGVPFDPNQPVRNAVSQVAAGIKAKGDAIMDKITNVFSGLTGETGDIDQAGMIGKYDQIPKDIKKQQAVVDSLIGPQNMEKQAAAVQKLNQLKANLKLANNMLDRQGLQGAREQADALFKQADDLQAVSKSVNKATTGIKGVKGANPERINGQKLGPALEEHYGNGVLQNAVGEENSHHLINVVNTGGRMQRNALIGRRVITAAPIVGEAAHHYGVVQGAVDAVKGLAP